MMRLRGGGCCPSKAAHDQEGLLGTASINVVIPTDGQEKAASSREQGAAGTDSMAAVAPDDPYANYSALIDSVESGAVAPLRGSWLLSLYERKGRIERRQDLPPEAFWTAAELRTIVERAKAHFGDDESAGLAAVGRLFTALS
jgi:hypothetical protein